ncbi:MAG: DUF4388 domain-containing protein [Acidobacteria bacterium]|nr:DUF4388 domain-containing protein [Acidobacteriota bacterium]
MARTLSGNLDTFSLADLLQWLEINALSGRVTVWRGEVVRTIDLKGGAIVFVSSSLPNERLGVFLTRRKVLTEPVVFELLAESFATGRNLTRLILERNLLPREKLAEAVEGLAMKVLLDLFHWAGASFEFDPLFKIEDLIRIHLSLRGQVLAFHGAKSVDDSRVNVGTAAGSDETGARWEREFKAESLAAMFWEILEGLPGETPSPAQLKESYQGFTSFANRVHKRLREPSRLFPVYDDTAVMLKSALDEGGDPERIVQVAALDPFLTIDLLYLANALRTESTELVRTCREAAGVLGNAALRRFVGLLADPSTPKVPSEEKMERVIRRAALSTAVAASHLAEGTDIPREEAYTLGLLEPLGSYELLKLLISVPFPPGPIRIGALSRFRAAAGRVLARKLNLPQAVEDVLGSSGRVASRSPAAEQLIFLAKQIAPSEQIGHEWTTEDPKLSDQVVALSARAELPQLVARDASMLREILQL